jgi:hypothetical protein
LILIMIYYTGGAYQLYRNLFTRCKSRAMKVLVNATPID